MREVRLDEETGTATVIVSDFQLSLAIGKEGQNARLAARLTGWRIDIKSETQLAEEEAGYADQDWAEGEWVENESGDLVWKPAEGGEAMSAEEWSHQAEDTSEAPATEAGEADGAAEASAETEPATAPEAEPAGEARCRSRPWCQRRPRHNADTDLCRLPESPAGRPADPNRPVAGRGAVGGPARPRAGGLDVPGVAGLSR